tara:strand:- start:436 stop:846 length:411 start_codon:yes stop_codon:yes gene_type:complete
MSSIREQIVSKIYSALSNQRTVKLGVVKRDPIIPDELPRTGFPALSIESTDEERTPLTSTMYESIMEVECVVYVNGANRDSQRNEVLFAVENKVLADVEIKALVSDIYVTRIENIENGQASPYASSRLVFTVRYCY